jgi:hypothetical protein
MADSTTHRKAPPNPDELVGVTESGKAFLGLSAALLMIAIIIFSFALTTC